MGAIEINRALGAEYEPTGVYSFEFRTPKNHTLAEIFMLLPPDSVKIREPQIGTLTRTLGGSYLADFGSDFKDITLGGQAHFHYAGTVARPGKQSGRTATSDTEYITGYEEFLKLRFMFGRYRDYTITPRNKVVGPIFFKQELVLVAQFKAEIERRAASKGALADEIRVLYHDYDDDNHFFVKVDEFEFDRSARDPRTAVYIVKMRAYQYDTNRSSQMISGSVITRKMPVMEKIRQVKIQFDAASPETTPDTLEVPLYDNTFPITNTVPTLTPTTVVLPS